MIAALLACTDRRSACLEAGVAVTTFYSWMKQPAFVAALREAEAEALAEISRELAVQATTALEVISAVMRDTEAPAAVRLRAADTILARLLQVREVVDLERRMAQLEARLAA